MSRTTTTCALPELALQLAEAVQAAVAALRSVEAAAVDLDEALDNDTSLTAFVNDAVRRAAVKS